MPISLKRVYEKPGLKDGKRILVERLWPRGLKKDEAKIDEWLREVAPSTELRKWFGHDPAKWDDFKERYWKELDKKKDIISKLAKERLENKVTFVFAAKDQQHNNAVALKEYIENQLMHACCSGDKFEGIYLWLSFLFLVCPYCLKSLLC
jgi:uncharacterized protein YeaO (DUF488 family)